MPGPAIAVPALALGVLLAPAALSAQSGGDVVLGERIFTAQCARCHGIGGTGGEGPALQGRRFRSVREEGDIVRVIQDGIGAMPSFWIGDAEAGHVATYVWSLARTELGEVPGDPDAGRALFEGKGACTTCHIVRGVGVGLGPDLTDVGARRGLEYLRRAILAPGAELPGGQLTPHASFLMVSAVDEEGVAHEGMRVWEDAFVVQIREAQGAYRHLRKARLTSFERRFGASLMPEYAEILSTSEVTDLVAYLSSLRGTP